MTLSTVVPLLTLVVLSMILLLERIHPYDRGQKVIREGFWTDLVFYTLVQTYALAFVIGRLIAAMDRASGLSRLHLVTDWPLPAQVAFFVLTHDLYIYWFHRLQHSSPVLWRLHEAHHSATSVDWLTSMRSHSLEILINQTIEFAPMILLGASPEVPLLKTSLNAIWGVWIHANVDVRTGWLQRVVNGPEAHRWHHAVDEEAFNKNFATKLALWDRLFGTAFLPKDRKPTGYGLGALQFPRGYLKQQAFAFRPFAKGGANSEGEGARAVA